MNHSTLKISTTKMDSCDDPPDLKNYDYQMIECYDCNGRLFDFTPDLTYYPSKGFILAEPCFYQIRYDDDGNQFPEPYCLVCEKNAGNDHLNAKVHLEKIRADQKCRKRYRELIESGFIPPPNDGKNFRDANGSICNDNERFRKYSPDPRFLNGVPTKVSKGHMELKERQEREQALMQGFHQPPGYQPPGYHQIPGGNSRFSDVSGISMAQSECQSFGGTISNSEEQSDIGINNNGMNHNGVGTGQINSVGNQSINGGQGINRTKQSMNGTSFQQMGGMFQQVGGMSGMNSRRTSTMSGMGGNPMNQSMGGNGMHSLRASNMNNSVCSTLALPSLTKEPSKAVLQGGPVDAKGELDLSEATGVRPVDWTGREIDRTHFDWKGYLYREYAEELWSNPHLYELFNHNGNCELRCRACPSITKINSSHTPRSKEHDKGLQYNGKNLFLECGVPLKDDHGNVQKYEDEFGKLQTHYKQHEPITSDDNPEFPAPIDPEDLIPGIHFPKSFQQFGQSFRHTQFHDMLQDPATRRRTATTRSIDHLNQSRNTVTSRRTEQYSMQSDRMGNQILNLTRIDEQMSTFPSQSETSVPFHLLSSQDREAVRASIQNGMSNGMQSNGMQNMQQGMQTNCTQNMQQGMQPNGMQNMQQGMQNGGQQHRIQNGMGQNMQQGMQNGMVQSVQQNGMQSNIMGVGMQEDITGQSNNMGVGMQQNMNDQLNMLEKINEQSNDTPSVVQSSNMGGFVQSSNDNPLYQDSMSNENSMINGQQFNGRQQEGTLNDRQQEVNRRGEQQLSRDDSELQIGNDNPFQQSANENDPQLHELVIQLKKRIEDQDQKINELNATIVKQKATLKETLAGQNATIARVTAEAQTLGANVADLKAMVWKELTGKQLFCGPANSVPGMGQGLPPVIEYCPTIRSEMPEEHFQSPERKSVEELKSVPSTTDKSSKESSTENNVVSELPTLLEDEEKTPAIDLRESKGMNSLKGIKGKESLKGDGFKDGFKGKDAFLKYMKGKDAYFRAIKGKNAFNSPDGVKGMKGKDDWQHKSSGKGMKGKDYAAKGAPDMKSNKDECKGVMKDEYKGVMKDEFKGDNKNKGDFWKGKNAKDNEENKDVTKIVTKIDTKPHDEEKGLKLSVEGKRESHAVPNWNDWSNEWPAKNDWSTGKSNGSTGKSNGSTGNDWSTRNDWHGKNDWNTQYDTDKDWK